jgi:hypothetical protein
MRILSNPIIIPVLLHLLFAGAGNDPSTPGPQLLFSSGFEEGVYLDVFDGYYQPILGTDSETGFSWPITVLGASESALHFTVPDSHRKPHIFSNYKYYKRILSKNQLMEEFEIRSLYQQVAKSSLRILNLSKLQGIPLMNSGKFEEMKFYPRIHIQNIGQRIEKYYKLEIAIPSALIDESFTVLHKYLKGYNLDQNIYSIPSTEPLFQMESKTVIELVIKLNAHNYSSFKESSIDLKLYSTEGVHEQTYKLSDWLHYKGQQPQIESFVKKIEE